LTVAAVIVVPAVYGDTARLYVPEPLRAMRVLHDRMPALCYGRGMIDAVWWRCLVACIAGAAAWLSFPPTENPIERLAFALICGFGSVWLAGRLWAGLDRVGRALLSGKRRN